MNNKLLKLFITFFLILLLIFVKEELSYRNAKKIIHKAPYFMRKYNFKPIDYINSNGNLIYGGEVSYYTKHKKDSSIYKITFVYHKDELLMHELKKIDINDNIITRGGKINK
jgi:hypothetical protein